MSSRISSSSNDNVSDVTEFLDVSDNDSPSCRSVRNVVASFETQQRQIELTSPKAEDRQSSGMTSSRVNVARLRAAHLRSASEDFSRMNLLNQQVVVSSGNTGGGPANSLAGNQANGRSVADLRAVLQKSSEEETTSSNEKPSCRIRARDVDVDLKRIEELELSFKRSVGHVNSGNNGSPSDSSFVLELDCRLISVDNDQNDVSKTRQSSHKKPRPKVLPKPLVKRLPNGDVQIEKCARGCYSKNMDNEIIEGRSEIHRPMPDVCSGVQEVEPHSSSSDNVELSKYDISETTSCSRVKLTTSSSSSVVDALTNEMDLRCSIDNFQVESAPVCRPDLVLTRRHSSRRPNSGDSSRTSSNLSVFGSSTNVDSIVDDDILVSNSFYSSQADSGINIHESSYDSISNVMEGIASPSSELHFDQVSALLTASYGNSSVELSQIIFEWSNYRTALDYIGELYVEACEVQRHHVHFLSLCCRVSDSGVQYLSLEALMEAVREKVTQKRDELQRAKVAVDNEIISIKHLETKVSKAIKLKATDPRHYDKFGVYFEELDKVTQLLLILSSRLSRIDNSINKLVTPGDGSQLVSLTSRRSELLQKLDDARLLKSDIDRRSEALANCLVPSLDVAECSEFAQLITERCRLSLQRQEIVDWTRLTDEHVRLLSRNYEAMLCKSASVC